MMKHFEVSIYGRVQGVGFRYSANSRAQSLNLLGWVRNRQDGSVQAAIQGDETSCKAFIEWCKTGPEFSRVESVEVHEYPLIDMEPFSVRY